MVYDIFILAYQFLMLARQPSSNILSKAEMTLSKYVHMLLMA